MVFLGSSTKLSVLINLCVLFFPPRIERDAIWGPLGKRKISYVKPVF